MIMRSSSARPRPLRRRRVRRGFSLIEIMVAMTMLSIVLLSLAKLATVVGVRGRANAVAAKRNAVLQLETNKLDAIPFASLGTFPTGSQADSLNGFAYTRRLSITKVNSQRYTVTIVVLPAADTTHKDSVTFDRTLPPANSPLCVGC